MTAKAKSATKKVQKTTKKPRKKQAKKEPKQVATPVHGKYPHHPKNPFTRPTSSYAIAFDILASRKSGIRKDEAVKLLAQATGKDEKHAAYDLAVLLSAKESPAGMRHKSCREGFFVNRQNDHLLLVV